jgi:hypothetical protein
MVQGDRVAAHVARFPSTVTRSTGRIRRWSRRIERSDKLQPWIEI